MSLFTRGLAGAASAGAQITSRYIDEGLAAQRAQMLAELQRTTATNIRNDDDAFRNDPTRVQRDRDRRSADIESEGSARNKTDLAGKRAEATDTNLTTALANRETILGKAKSKVEIEKATEMLPLEVKKAYALAEAQAKAAAKYREGRPNPAADLKAKFAFMEGALGRPLAESEKLGLFGLAKGADKETDRVKITDEEMLPGGGTRKTERTEVRRAGGGSADATDPYAVPKRDVPGKKDAGPRATEPQAETKPAWAPDPASPAGQRRSIYEAARDKREGDQAGERNAAAVREAVAEDKAAQVLASGDKRLMYRFQSSPEFSDLSAATRAKVSAAVTGR